MELNPVILSRIQFAFVVSFHIIFPAFTIGLAAWLATIEGMRLATGNPVYRRVFDFWLKVFALSFGMGVVQRHRHGLPVRHQLERACRAHRADPGSLAGL
jgi:cytochrome bd-type quinol oxidase subunit 1